MLQFGQFPKLSQFSDPEPIEKRKMLSPHKEGPCDTMASISSNDYPKAFSQATVIIHSNPHVTGIEEYQDLS